MDLYIRKRVIFVSCFIECLMLGGPPNGWPSLVYVLRDRGFFSDLCSRNTTLDDCVKNDVNSSATDSLDMQVYPTCAEQDARLQLVFIIGSFGLNSGALILGHLYDKYGIRFTRIISSVLVLLASLMFAFSSQSTSYISFVALHLWATGSILLVISSAQVGNLFGNYRSTIISLNVGAFGSSAITMLLVQIAYIEGVSMMTSFLILAGVTLFFNINTFILLPKYKIPWPLPENWGKEVSGHCAIEDGTENELVVLQGPPTASYAARRTSWMDVEYQSLFKCLTSPMFLWTLTWFSVVQLISYFYIGTFNPRLQQLSNDDPDTISIYTTSFTALNSTMVLISPLCGLVIDRNKKKMTSDGRGPDQRTSLDDLQDSVLALLLTTTFIIAFSICVLIPVLPVQSLTFAFHTLGRSFIYGMLAPFITIAFPARYFGSVYGVCRVIAASIALLQYPLFQMVQGLFDENPFYVDLFLFILSICALGQPIYVYYFVSKRKRIYMATTGHQFE